MRIFLALSVLFWSHLSFAVEIGESVKYKLNRSRARTSSLISGGSFEAKIISQAADHEQGPSYIMSYHYRLKIRFSGTEIGKGAVALPENFFNGKTIEKLRKEGHVKNKYFKAKHLGREDVVIGENKYLASDVVELWDINFDEQNLGLAHFIKTILASSLPENESSMLSDVIVKAYIHPNIDVVGASKVDIQGVMDGFRFRMGFDIESN